MSNVVNFPLTHSRNAPYYREPLHQALRKDGVPIRGGDAVKVTDTRAREHSGIVSKVGMAGASAVMEVYEVRCNDGYSRVVTADQIKALA